MRFTVLPTPTSKPPPEIIVASVADMTVEEQLALIAPTVEQKMTLFASLQAAGIANAAGAGAGAV